MENKKNFLIRYIKFIASKGHMDFLDFNKIYNELIERKENINNVKDMIEYINKNYNVHTNFKNYIESLGLTEIEKIISI